MNARRRAKLIQEFTKAYGFAPTSGELRQLKRAFLRKETRTIRLDRKGASFFPIDRRNEEGDRVAVVPTCSQAKSP